MPVMDDFDQEIRALLENSRGKYSRLQAEMSRLNQLIAVVEAYLATGSKSTFETPTAAAVVPSTVRGKPGRKPGRKSKQPQSQPATGEAKPAALPVAAGNSHNEPVIDAPVNNTGPPSEDPPSEGPPSEGPAVKSARAWIERHVQDMTASFGAEALIRYSRILNGPDLASGYVNTICHQLVERGILTRVSAVKQENGRIAPVFRLARLPPEKQPPAYESRPRFCGKTATTQTEPVTA